MKHVEFSVLIGKTLTSVDIAEDKESVTLHTADGGMFRMFHDQDCCESVELEDVVGDWADIIGLPLAVAEVSTNESEDPEDCKKNRSSFGDDSFTWTFYRLATEKGWVTLRWYGTSNGYYSEGVTFVQIGEFNK